MWVPVPGLLAEAGPMAWPGRARVGVDILLIVYVCFFQKLVLRFNNVACDGDLARVWIKSRSDAALGRSPRESVKREEGQKRMVETYQLPNGIHACRATRRHGKYTSSAVCVGEM